MTPQEQAFHEGFLEALQKVAFCAGFLEACAEAEVSPEETLETACALFEKRARILEQLKSPTPVVRGSRPANAEQSWIQTTQNLSPPRRLKHAA